MLRIQFGKKNNVFYGPSYFKANYDIEWLNDSFVQDMIEDVDNSSFEGGDLISSSVLGPISPRELSGGVQTLICIYKNPELVFDATSCGSNCSKWLLEIGRRMDVTICLEYFMPFDNLGEIDIYIENVDKRFNDSNEYAIAALKVLQEDA